MSTRAPKGTQAIVRAIHLLKAVSEHRMPVSLDVLADSLEISKPTVHRIAAALCAEGMLVQHPVSRKFSLGPDTAALGVRALGTYNARSTIHPVLEQLAEATGETATFETPVGLEMLILDEVSGESLIGAHPEIGTRWPMHATSSGKVVLAFGDDQLAARIFRRNPTPLTDTTLASETDLRHELERVRERGYALALEELQAGFCAVSVPLRDLEGRTVATLSLGGPAARMKEDRLHTLAADMLAGTAHIRLPRAPGPV